MSHDIAAISEAAAESWPRAVSHKARRICVALPDLLPFGGVETLSMALIREFLALGYQVDLILANERNDLSASDVIPQGVRVFEFGAPRMRNFMRPFMRYLRAENPDAVLAAMWPFTVWSILAARLANSSGRIVVSDHNTMSLQYGGGGVLRSLALRMSLFCAYRFASARVAVSAGVAGDVAKLAGMSRERFTVIHNPMPLDLSRDCEGRADDAAWEGWTGKRVVTVGRLKAQKNHRLLIGAFKSLLGHLDARLMIVGTGELEAETRALIEQEGLTGKVFMPGHVDNPEAFYRSADLFVLSSDYEGFGNVVVEALAFGLPVVSTDCPSGPAEILENGRYGRLVPVGDLEALATAMALSLNESHDTQALRRRAADFTPAKAAQQYLDLFFPDIPAVPAAIRGEDSFLMIEKLQTLLWFIQRPNHWAHAFELAVRKVRVDRDGPGQAASAHAWAASRAVPVADALAALGLSGTEATLDPALLAEGEELAKESLVRMGGPGDYNLLYSAVKLSNARQVIETGVAYGWSSLAILAALDGRAGGALVSVDMPYPKMNGAQFVGVVVPERLRNPWTIVREPDRWGLRKAIDRIGGAIDLCHYDSDKSWWGREYGFPLLWDALRPGGVFISDDIQDNMAFAEFVDARKLTFAVTEFEGKFVGIARKPV